MAIADKFTALAKGAANAHEFFEKASAEGLSITEEEASALYSDIGSNKMSDDELESVSGGANSMPGAKYYVGQTVRFRTPQGQAGFGTITDVELLVYSGAPRGMYIYQLGSVYIMESAILGLM